MKKVLLFCFALLLSHFVFAGGSQPGNWRWRNNNGTTGNGGSVSSTSAPSGTSATWAAAVNKPITVHTTDEVLRLRLQLDGGSLPSSSAGHIFLQFYDAGPKTTATTLGSTSTTSDSKWEYNPMTGQPQPITSYRGPGNGGASQAGEASSNNASSDRLSGGFSTGGSTSAQWTTIASVKKMLTVI